MTLFQTLQKLNAEQSPVKRLWLHASHLDTASLDELNSLIVWISKANELHEINLSFNDLGIAHAIVLILNKISINIRQHFKH